MRCFFNVIGLDEEVRDEHGVEVADLTEAEGEALKAIEELREEEPDGRDMTGWRMEIVDEAGRVLSTLDLSGLSDLPLHGHHPARLSLELLKVQRSGVGIRARARGTFDRT